MTLDVSGQVGFTPGLEAFNSGPNRGGDGAAEIDYEFQLGDFIVSLKAKYMTIREGIMGSLCYSLRSRYYYPLLRNPTTAFHASQS